MCEREREGEREGEGNPDRKMTTGPQILHVNMHMHNHAEHKQNSSWYL